jgi:hypothetical protein
MASTNGPCTTCPPHSHIQTGTRTPPISPTNIPSFVTCRACEIAKLKKDPRGHLTLDPADLQPGQSFHMDLAFIRGPANLQAVVDRVEEAQPKVIHSRHGYTCHLLIVDRKSRYMWTFPLRSRSVSINGCVSFYTWKFPSSTTHDSDGR